MQQCCEFTEGSDRIFILHKNKNISVLENKSRFTSIYPIYQSLKQTKSFSKLSYFTLTELAQGYQELSPFSICFLSLLIYLEESEILDLFLQELQKRKIKIVFAHDCLEFCPFQLLSYVNTISVAQLLIDFIYQNSELISINKTYPAVTEKNNSFSMLLKKNLSNLQLLCDSRIFPIQKIPFSSKEFSGVKLASFKDLSHDESVYVQHGLIKPPKQNEYQIEVTISALEIKGILHPNSQFLAELNNFNESHPLFQSQALKYILDFKWQLYAKNVFIRDMAIYFIFFILSNAQGLFIFPERAERNDIDDKYRYRVWSVILNFIILVLNLYNTIHEFCLIYYGRLYKSYLSVVGVFTWTVYIFSFVTVITDLLQSFQPDRVGILLLRIFHSIVICFIWSNFILIFRAFRRTSFLIRTVIEVFTDMIYFLIIMICIILPLSFSGFLLQPNLNDMGRFRIFRIFYQLIYGDFGEFLDLLYDDSPSKAIIYIIFLIATILNVIVLLNLLIAIISDTFERVSATNEQVFTFERMKIIHSIERNLTYFALKNYQDLEDSYLYIATPKENDKDNNKLQEGARLKTRVMKVESKTIQISIKLQQIEKQIQDFRSEQSSLLQQLQKTLIEEIKKK